MALQRTDGSPPGYPQAVSFHVQVGRNQVVQGLGLSMVALIGLSVAHWATVIAWTLVTMTAVVAEDHLLRRRAFADPTADRARLWAAALRVLITSLYATAALVLIVKGQVGARLFAFALMSASMVHVLMRCYRAPVTLLASLTPWVIVLVLSGIMPTLLAFKQGHLLSALAPPFTVLMFGVQFWAARAQLSGAWDDLMNARRAAEQREQAAEAANRAKSQFLATMTHELCTPLNGVLGMAQAMTGDALSPSQRERLGVIRQCSENLLAVLNDLLDLSRMEAGSFELEPVEFDLEKLMAGVAAAYETLATKKALQFTCEVADDARGRYLGDTARIRRILHNLTDNAVKFTHEGAVALRARRDGENVVISVSDSGIGIAAGDLERLFERFFQVDASLRRRYSGAGIGLAICGELATLMGGAIDATSEPGLGSTFTLTLPLTSAALPGAAADADARDDGGPLRVLAAEDNPTNQLVLKTLLAPVGIDPTLVDNGRAALDAWERQGWDIILMDIQMPEMDGVEAAAAIRRREGETGRLRTPIVAVTANASGRHVTEYMAAGMDGVVGKPVEISRLFAVMDEALAAPAAAAAVAQAAPG